MTSLRGQERQEFPQKVRKEAFRRCCQKAPAGVANIPSVPQCESCGKELRAGGIVYEHDQPDGLGGEPTAENCKVHCSSCATEKTVKEDNPRMAKADAVLKASFGLRPSRKKMQSRGFERAPPQRTASRPIERRS